MAIEIGKITGEVVAEMVVVERQERGCQEIEAEVLIYCSQDLRLMESVIDVI